MKTNAGVFIVLACCLAAACLACDAAQVAVPDAALEAAIQRRIGNDGIAGVVDRDWLLGRDGEAGPYAGEPGGLTSLGVNGDTLEAVAGIGDLTGLESADNLVSLFLCDSSFTSLSPLLSLDNLGALGFDRCGMDDVRLEKLLTASFSLVRFGLMNSSEGTGPCNHVGTATLARFLSRHNGLRQLALTNLGTDLDTRLLSPPARLADPPCQLELYLSHNTLTNLAGLSSFHELTLLDLNACNLSDALLAQVDWSRLSCLQTLHLTENAITSITPLLGLRARPGGLSQGSPVTLDLSGNRLDAVSIAEHIPLLKQSGCDVLFEMELFLEVEGEGDLPPSAGSAWYPYGEQVLRIARPRPDSNQGFIGWRGDVVTDDYDATVEMTGHRRLTAVFSETPAPGRRFHALSVAVTGTGEGTVLPAPGRSLFREGERVGLLATPASGSYFGGWRIDAPGGDEEGGEATGLHYESSWPVDMVGEVNATARFEDAGHILALDVVGMGEVSLPPGAYPLAAGTVLTLSALPAAGWRLRHWEDDTGTVLHAPEDGADSSYTLTLSKDMTVRAVFEQATRTLTLVVTGEDGASGSTVPPGSASGQTQTYAYGEKVTILARPQNAESAFAGWSGDLPAGLSRTEILKQQIALAMTEDRVITARFVPAEVTLYLEFNADGLPFDEFLPEDQRRHGFVRDIANEVPVNIDLKQMPIAFVRWEGDVPEGVNPDNYSIVVPMDRDRHLVAMLQTKNIHTIGLSVVGEGKTIPSPGTYTVIPGRQMLLQAVPDAGKDFLGWKIGQADGTFRTLILPRINLNIIGNASIEAQFGEAAHRLWVGATAEGGSLMPPPGVYRVADGAVVDLEATPPEGSAFYHWATENGEVISELPSTRLTVTKDLSCHAVFGPPGTRLVVQTEGAGSGAVTVFPEGGVVRPPGSTVELRAVPDSDSLFTRWEGATVMGVNPTSPVISVTLDHDRHIRAVFDKANFTLTMEVAGLPDGVVALVSPAPGVHGYRTGEMAALFAAPPPDSGLAFVGWEGSLETSDQPIHATKMSQDRYVVARFAPVETVGDAATLTILPAEGDGGGTTSPLLPGRYHFVRGAAVDVSFVLDGDSYFGGWIGDYAGDIAYPTLSVVLDGDKSVGVRFSSTGVLLTIGLNDSEAGAVYPPPGGYRISRDLEVFLSATRLNTQRYFAGWFDASGKRMSAYGRYRLQFPPDAESMSVIAVFLQRTGVSPMEYCRAGSVNTLH